MKLVIDIPVVTYEEVKCRGLYLYPRDSEALVNSIKNGTQYEERPHGEWGKWVISEVRCPECLEYFDTGCYSKEEMDKCPNCGADMSANDRQVTGKLDENTQKHYGFRKKY